MRYVHFIGCTSIEEVKTKYKQLAKVAHPDTSTGSHDKFTTLKNEFDHILEGRSLFPITNLPNVPTLDLNETFYEGRNGVGHKPKEKVHHLTPEELKIEQEERIRTFYANLRMGDVIFDQIDAIIQQAAIDKARKLWVYQEVQKIDELTLDHFKYLTFILEDPVSIAQVFYKKYHYSKIV